ncbi:MAG: FtsW/RodA/SpoVE family cell cycle protein [Armatimonadetes bacterium]|nr:MAG: FtsW/RodA/SpoVE family cell cycle protein [Armatimonadota bacterium]
MRSLPATAPSVRTYGVSDTAPTRKAQVHSAMLWTPFLLALIGLVFQFSVGITDLLRPNKDGAFPDLLTALRPALMQGAWLVLGAAAMGTCRTIRARLWLGTAWFWLLLSFMWLLWLTAKLPGALTLNGATRWVGIPFPGIGMISVQPAEFFKLATLLWFAWAYSAVRPRGVWFGFAVWFAGTALIVLQPDKDTAGLVFLIGFGVMFLGGLRWGNVMLWLTLACLGGVLLTVMPLMRSHLRDESLEKQPGAYVTRRVLAVLNPRAYESDIGYQMVRAQIAVGSGGLIGVGLGEGREKHHLPAAENDYIFATIAEETGLVGSLLVCGLLGLFVWSCFRNAERAPTRPARLFLGGLGIWVGVGALMNISMAIGLLPTMGLPLPFVSAGGSALVSLMAAVGIAQSLMRETP